MKIETKSAAMPPLRVTIPAIPPSAGRSLTGRHGRIISDTMGILLTALILVWPVTARPLDLPWEQAPTPAPATPQDAPHSVPSAAADESPSGRAEIEASRDECVNTMRMIESSKEQWALENNMTAGAVVDIQAVHKVLGRAAAPCPAGGRYTYGAIGQEPSCSAHGRLGDAPPQGDDKSGIASLRRRAEAGDPRAQFEMGLAYLEGVGVSWDDEEAMRWFRRASEKGYREHIRREAEEGVALAQFHHGMYMFIDKTAEIAGLSEGNADEQAIEAMWASDETQRVLSEAVRWVRRAAHQRLPGAQYHLGEFCSAGVGLPADEVIAALLFRRAAEQGYGAAQHREGLRHVEKGDHAEAMRWFLLAAAQDVIASYVSIGRHYEQQGNHDEAARWYHRAAMEGSLDGKQMFLSLCWRLSTAYELGEGMERNVETALLWKERAKELE